MLHVSEIMDADLLDRMLSEGYVRSQSHPRLPLTIYNYTQSTVYDDLWNSATLACRGLILDDGKNIVARPFSKFFNLGERAQPQFAMSDYPAQIFNKLDGSLGIIYEYDGTVAVATRGSFTSDQSVWATNFMADVIFEGEEMYKFWPDDVTPLVEIIYPENRIVVDYGGQKDLVMLGAIRHCDGSDMHIDEIQEWWQGTVVQQFPEMGIQGITHEVNSDNHANEEGVVMVWYRPGAESHRLKVKRSDYVQLHRIVTGMTARKVWSMCKDGEDIEEVLSAGVPEEFYGWVRRKASEFNGTHILRTKEITAQFRALMERPDLMKDDGLTIDRKKFASAVKALKDKSYLFALLDNKDIHDVLWEEIYPGHEVPFGKER